MRSSGSLSRGKCRRRILEGGVGRIADALEDRAIVLGDGIDDQRMLRVKHLAGNLGEALGQVGAGNDIGEQKGDYGAFKLSGHAARITVSSGRRRWGSP